MESFLFALGAVAPIVIMVAIGYFLKKIGLMQPTITKAVNRLVFHVFLPVMLFLNIYKVEDLAEMNLGYAAYVLTAIVAIFAIGIPLVMLVTKHKERRGVLLQGIFRSNFALIGIPLTKSLFGEAGVAVASLLAAVVVPLLNVLAVISLSVFRNDGSRPSVKKILLGIVQNPLIQGVAAGFLTVLIRSIFVKYGIGFRLTDITPIYTVLGYLSNLATPLALLSLGAQFEFSAVASLKKEIVFGTFMRTVVVPVLGLGAAYLLFSSYFSGAHFAVFIAVFATPVSVSSVPMAQEMGGDAVLAGQLVIWSTVMSAFSIFLASFLLRWAGVL